MAIAIRALESAIGACVRIGFVIVFLLWRLFFLKLAEFFLCFFRSFPGQLLGGFSKRQVFSVFPSIVYPAAIQAIHERVKGSFLQGS